MKVRKFIKNKSYDFSSSGFNLDQDDYLYKHAGKDLQLLAMSSVNTGSVSSSSHHSYYSFSCRTGEFDPSLSIGLEMPAPSGRAILIDMEHLPDEHVTFTGFDFHARFYDPQLGRWFTPDPAMQFSNPYLGIANNPVNYVDPDGEFAIIAGLIIAKKIAAKIAIGAKVAGAYAKAGMKIAGTVGKVSAKKAAAFSKTKGFKAGLRGGTVNTLSNYDYDEGWDDFGWGTIGDFAAGFGGAYAGTAYAKKLTAKGMAAGLTEKAAQKAARFPGMAVSFNAGGALNATSQIMQDGFGSGYEFAQDWVGGGLSGIVGTGYALKSTAKFGGKFLSYAGQSAMYDFAHTKQEDFAKRNFGDFVTLYGIGGVMGASVGSLKGMEIKGQLSNRLATKAVKTGFNSIISLTELRMTSQLKGKPGKPKPQPNKGSVLGAKLWFNFLNF